MLIKYTPKGRCPYCHTWKVREILEEHKKNCKKRVAQERRNKQQGDK